ncbi:MAG: pentapeptide repeat-containing protein [Cyanobacteria bacterium P01_G01_bin.19]
MNKQYLESDRFKKAIASNNETTNIEGWQQLQTSFAELYEIEDPDRREYELHREAKKCDVPIDIYRQLFQNYNQAQLVTGGKKILFLLGKSPQKAFKTAFDVLSRLGWLSMIGVFITLSLQLYEIYEREEYFGWAILGLNQGKEANGGRILALENLKLFGSQLTGLNLENAVLPHLDLSGTDLLQANLQNATLIEANLSNSQLVYANLQKAFLEKANFQGADLKLSNLQDAQLYQANLSGANLYQANFYGTNLSGANLTGVKNIEKANFYRTIYDVNTKFPPQFNPEENGAILISSNADLTGVNLQGATLAQVDLSDANLAGVDLSNAVLIDTNLSNTNLEGANLTGAIGLTPSQLKAAKNWDKARYDADFQKELGLSI